MDCRNLKTPAPPGQMLHGVPRTRRGRQRPRVIGGHIPRGVAGRQTAAAWTYVAAFLSSLFHLLHLLALRNRN